MELKIRALIASFSLHLLAVGLFFLWMSNSPSKSLPEPIKIHVASFFTPAVVEKVIAPVQPKSVPVVKQTVPHIQPIVKNIPIQKIPIVQSHEVIPVPSIPVAAVTQAQPISVPIASKEIPKVITPPPPAVNSEKEFLDAHLGEIRGVLLQNLKYPKMAQKLKMQGTVRVAFTLNVDGSVENIKVVESSGFEILDEDAMKLIEKTASSFPKPTKSVRISAPLGYILH